MNYRLTTDTHFGHKEMHEQYGRPRDFESLIIKSLERIPETDTLIHIGDICIGGDLLHHEHIKRLKCRKILVKGNHDKKSNTWYLNNGWDFVVDSFTFKMYGYDILFTHKPQPTDFFLNIHGHLHTNTHRGLSPDGCLGISMELDRYNIYTLQYHLNRMKHV